MPANVNLVVTPNPIIAGPDNTAIVPRGDSYGSTIVQELNGKYAELVARGCVFQYSTTSAAAILLTNTTANGPTIWNPSTSNKVLYLLKLRLSWLSGTTTASSLIWNKCTPQSGAVTATAPTGSQILTFTNVAPVNALKGGSQVSAMGWAPVTSTFTAAPAFDCATGINLTATTIAQPLLEVDYEGEMAYMPGTALTLNAAVTTTTALFFVTIWAAELPFSAHLGQN